MKTLELAARKVSTSSLKLGSFEEVDEATDTVYAPLYLNGKVIGVVKVTALETFYHERDQEALIKLVHDKVVACYAKHKGATIEEA